MIGQPWWRDWQRTAFAMLLFLIFGYLTYGSISGNYRMNRFESRMDLVIERMDRMEAARR